MENSGNLQVSDSSVLEVTGNIMVGAIIMLFFVVVFVFCLHMYIKWFSRRSQENTSSDRRRDFVAARQEMAAALRKGLDPSVLNTIPITVYDPKEFKDGLECSVCLCEVNAGEKARLLPECNHGFHMECIDMWFQSHSTCPICRNPVTNQTQASPESEAMAAENSLQTETPNLPTNVLFWGDETRVSTASPCPEEDSQKQSTEEPSSSSMASSSTNPDGLRPINEDEDQKSLISNRFRSLKRLLSGIGPSSPKPLDIEQGCPMTS